MSGIVVPSSDLVNYPLYQKVTNLQSIISNNKNPAATAQYRQQYPEAVRQLIDSLVATNKLSATAILATCTYGQADSNTY